MVGASLAVALAGLPVRVTLVEAVPAGGPASRASTPDHRASRSSQRPGDPRDLARVRAGGADPAHPRSERGRLGTTVIDGNEEGGEPLGYVLETGARRGAVACPRDSSQRHRPLARHGGRGCRRRRCALAVTCRRAAPAPSSARACWSWLTAPAPRCESVPGHRGADHVPTSRWQSSATWRCTAAAGPGARVRSPMSASRRTARSPSCPLAGAGSFVLTRRAVAAGAVSVLPDAAS